MPCSGPFRHLDFPRPLIYCLVRGAPWAHRTIVRSSERSLRMPELRKDPVSGRWVIISTERGRRPSDFGTEPERERAGFCPFCPGNESKTPPEVLAYRPQGPPNGPGWQVRVVPNKFPALQIEGDLSRQGDGMYDKMNGVGAHEVVIETPVHGETLAGMTD